MTTPETCAYTFEPTEFKCGLPTSGGHDTMCILHDPSPGKPLDEFNAKLEEKVIGDEGDRAAREIDLTGVVFPPDFIWGRNPVPKGIRFDGARFTGDAWFSGARFTGDAWFDGARFMGAAWFDDAQFKGDARFYGAQFTGDARFYGAQFTESLLFQGKTFSVQEKAGVVSFYGVVFRQPHRAYFRGVDLSRASFQNTDITHVQFAGCTWATSSEHSLWPLPLPRKLIGKMSARRQVIREHLELTAGESNEGQEARPSHQAVAEQYRQLRLSLEASKQEIEAGDFYIGQMDMRRLDDKEYPWLYRALLNIYRTVAIYGESYLRPLFFYFAFALLFAWAYQWRGCVGYFDGLFAGLTAGALFREIPVCIDGAERLLMYGNMLADILLLGLALVALRRRFHR